jgi:hypothetical protein
MKLLETGSDEESRLATKFVARIANAAFEGAEQARPTTFSERRTFPRATPQ